MDVQYFPALVTLMFKKTKQKNNNLELDHVLVAFNYNYLNTFIL